ncbi:MAG: TrmH family RNA methyltransferase [Flavobacteriales bacterium]|nr:TrmH family RNA methyltransferase [Flavobacteriales bacterium]
MVKKLIVALDNIRSHHNVGSVFRSADAFGVDELILGGISPKPPHRDIQKTALGATESVNWSSSDNLRTRIQELKEERFKIIAIEQVEGSIRMPQGTEIKEDKLVIILGNEVKGIDEELIEIADEIWEIPQHGIKKSLNVSVCAGICMYNILAVYG